MTTEELKLQIHSFLSYKKNRNNYGAKRFRRKHILFFEEMVDNLVVLPDKVMPSSNAGIIFEFHQNKVNLRISLMYNFLDCRLFDTKNKTVHICFECFSCKNQDTKVSVTYAKRHDFIKIINMFILMYEKIIEIYRL